MAGALARALGLARGFAARGELGDNRPAARFCALCGAEAQWQCSGCKSVYYCGAECQRTHWNENHKHWNHKRRCRALAAEKRAAFDTLANRARLFSAALQGDAASVLDLTERGANANFTEPLMGATPLFAAAQEGHYAVVRTLRSMLQVQKSNFTN